MKANKLNKILEERNITVYGLIALMKQKGYPSVNLKQLNQILNGTKQITCTLGARKHFPSLLQRICDTLGVKAGDIIEY
jgi:DNA-binding Xre family transcriptional regulator